MDDEVVWLALEDLWKHSFSRGSQRLLAKEACPGRRRLKRAAVVAAVAVPVVTSIVAPTAAHAATCLPSGAQCTRTSQCCQTPVPLVCAGGICTED